jgi:hypothetical protein
MFCRSATSFFFSFANCIILIHIHIHIIIIVVVMSIITITRGVACTILLNQLHNHAYFLLFIELFFICRLLVPSSGKLLCYSSRKRTLSCESNVRISSRDAS